MPNINGLRFYAIFNRKIGYLFIHIEKRENFYYRTIIL